MAGSVGLVLASGMAELAAAAAAAAAAGGKGKYGHEAVGEVPVCGPRQEQ